MKSPAAFHSCCRHAALAFMLLIQFVPGCIAQEKDSADVPATYRSIIRYNLSTAMLFGVDKHIVLGYERVIRPHQSISVNMGPSSLPKYVRISTDSATIKKDLKSTGFNVSVDYRFYLPKENKFAAPRGLYIGPYASYNHFKRENLWDAMQNTKFVKATSTFNVTTVGVQLGYQFIIWKRLALDFLMIGPGIGFYDYKVSFDSSIPEEKKQELYEALAEMNLGRIPGIKNVISEEDIKEKGTVKTTNFGYRYILHIGYAF